ncbi:MAG: drug/metabolite transporter (DMT)-like permease [Psychromonas sp.]|jgi:drug/metabolite transporter (DMT)-like permease
MKNETKSWLLLILLAMIWGASFILIKRGMFTMSGEPIFDHLQVGSLRMLFASIVLLPFGLKSIKKLKNWKEVLFLFIVGFGGNFLPSYLFAYAETGISSGYAGMLNSCTPIFTVLIAFFFFKVRLTLVQVVGIVIGTVGIVLLMLAGNLQPNNGGIIHVLSIVLATLFYGISLNIIKNKLQQFKSLEITALSLSFILIPALIANGIFGTLETVTTNEFALEGLLYLGILGVVGTAIAVVIFNRIITLRDPLFASSVTYFIPIVAILIGFFFAEKINLAQIASMLIVLIGVFFANYWTALKKRREVKKG